MSLINCKIHLELNWTEDCVMSNNSENTTFKITSTKLCVPIVTLSTKDHVNLAKQLNEGFKRSVYWDEYKSKVETSNLDNDDIPRIPLDASFEGVNRLFVLAFNNTTQDVANNPVNSTANRVQRDSHRKFFLLRVEITNHNLLIDSRNFYDQPVNVYSMMKLEKLQQEKEMIIQQDAC